MRARLPLLAAVLLCTHGLSQDNVLIILADDLGVDSLAVYGEGTNPPPSPNIDALAANGVMFRNCWSNPLCSPTRALLHTGRYAHRTGIGTVVQWQVPLPALLPEETTLPELLDATQSGYAHAAIGKWHLSNTTHGSFLGPNVAGWSHFAGSVPNPGNYVPWNRTVNGVSATCHVYMTTQNVDDALAWIRSVPEPWVCYLSFFSPHRPLHAPPESLHSQNLSGLNPQQNPIPFFHAMVEAMDSEIGRLITTLGPSVMARTNVMFLGDNGTDWVVTQPPFVVQHGKGTIYEGGINVPLIVSGPAVGAPGREESALVGVVDLFSTVATLCGVDVMPPFVRTDGVSFARHLTAANQPPVRSTIYSEFFDRNSVGPRPAAIRDRTHKLIRRFEFTPPRDELYHLIRDPFEQNDLLAGGAVAPEHQVQYAYLDREMRTLRDTGPSVSTYGAEVACVGSRGALSIGWAGQPSIGSTYTVTLGHAFPSQPAFLVSGSSRAWWGPVPLPFSMVGLGGGLNCALRASMDVYALTTTDGNGNASVTVPVPHSTLLVGASFYHQWLAFDVLAPNNPLNLTTSAGLAATIGL